MTIVRLREAFFALNFSIAAVIAVPCRAADCGGYFEGPLGTYTVPCPQPLHDTSGDRDDRRSRAEPRQFGGVEDADLNGAVSDVFAIFLGPLDALWGLLESARDAIKRARAERLLRRLEVEDLARRVQALRAESDAQKSETETRSAGVIELAQSSFETTDDARKERKLKALESERTRRAAEPKLDPAKKRAWAESGKLFDAAIDTAWTVVGDSLKPLIDKCRFKAMLAQETLFGTNPRYKRALEAGKKKGIVGPWQIGDKAWKDTTKDLARQFGEVPLERYDRNHSTFAAALYLQRIKVKQVEPLVGEPRPADEEMRSFILASYNMGYGTFRDVWRQAEKDLGRSPRTWAELAGEWPNPDLSTPLGKVLEKKIYKDSGRSTQYAAMSKLYKDFQREYRERHGYPAAVAEWSRYCKGDK